MLHAVTGRVQGIVDELGRTVRDPYDATDWLELLGNSARQRDFLNVLAIDRLVPAAIPAHDTEMMECLLRLPPAYRFGQRIYLRMYHLLDPRLRRIDYTSLGGPLSGSVWWNWWRQQLRETHRDVIDAGLRRLLHLGPSTRYQGSWPQAGSAMRRCPQWHEALRQCLASSRLVDLGIVSRAGLSQAIEEHLRRVRNHADLLSAWLTLEAWLETQG